LAVVPGHYQHRWEPSGALVIEGDEGVMNEEKLRERRDILRQRLLEITKSHHDRHLDREEEEGKQALSAFRDPHALKMWHHKFDPHSVAAIEPAELKP